MKSFYLILIIVIPLIGLGVGSLFGEYGGVIGALLAMFFGYPLLSRKKKE